MKMRLVLISAAVWLSFIGGFSTAQPAAYAYESDEATQEQSAAAAVDSVNGEVQDSWVDQADAFFGDYLVAPLDRVLFFDFWSTRWLRTGIPEKADCENPDGAHTIVIADAFPDGQVSIVFPCPECQHDVPTGESVPVVVVWLLLGAIFFTLRMGFINFRAFWHAIRLTRGDYDNPDEPGEVSHFQALASALSATIGLGNIAGVAIAVSIGGPGAILWMIVAGLLGMSSKFVECSLSQMYREVAPDGTISGGPMHYLHAGLKDLHVSLGPFGRVLAVIFAVFCIGGSFGGGCAFQVSQSLGAIREQVIQFESSNWLQGLNWFSHLLRETGLGEFYVILRGWAGSLLVGSRLDWAYGLLMVFLVALVIIGGIRRIAATAEKIVPLMCCVYLVIAVYVLLANFSQLGNACQLIVSEAFQWQSAYGGALGVLVTGIRRAAFSNEAGVGSAAIAHAAAKTEEPIREGIVASLGPFIDTVVICTITGLVIVVTGAYEKKTLPVAAEPAVAVESITNATGPVVAGEFSDADREIVANAISNMEGAVLTSKALESVVSWFPTVLCLAVVLFAYSTMISWSYYGERCWSHLVGHRYSLVYKVAFLGFVVLGAVVTANNILTFSDLMILSMAFPNILGVALLSGKVRKALDDYWKRYKAGEMEPKQTK